MWDLFQTQTVQPGTSHTRGLGYLRKTIESCHMATTKEITLGLNPSFVCDDVILNEGRFWRSWDWLRKPPYYRIEKGPEGLEDGAQARMDDLLEINLGTDKTRPTYISYLPPEEDREGIIVLLHEFHRLLCMVLQENSRCRSMFLEEVLCLSKQRKKKGRRTWNLRRNHNYKMCHWHSWWNKGRGVKSSKISIVLIPHRQKMGVP